MIQDRTGPTVRAVVRSRYGGPEVLSVAAVEPEALAPDRVLVRVRASSVNALDWHELRGEPMPVRMGSGVRRPRSERLGTDLTGVVEAVGEAVTDLAVGDEVLGIAPGAFAELVLARPTRLARKPAGLGWAEAGALPVAGCTALQAVRDHGGVAAGSRVLVVGAGGGVGSYVVQLARVLGGEVTAATRAGAVDRVRSLGASRVVDHGQEDVLADGARYDVIVDLGGTRPVGAYRQALVPGGRYVMIGGPSGRWIRPLDRMVAARLVSLRGTERFVAFMASVEPAALAELAALAAGGALRPVVDRTVDLGGVAGALADMEAGRVRGKIGVTISS